MTESRLTLLSDHGQPCPHVDVSVVNLPLLGLQKAHTRQQPPLVTEWTTGMLNRELLHNQCNRTYVTG